MIHPVLQKEALLCLPDWWAPLHPEADADRGSQQLQDKGLHNAATPLQEGKVLSTPRPTHPYPTLASILGLMSHMLLLWSPAPTILTKVFMAQWYHFPSHGQQVWGARSAMPEGLLWPEKEPLWPQPACTQRCTDTAKAHSWPPR